MINQDLEEEAKSHGLTLGMDGTNLSSHAVFEEYKDRLNNKILVNQSPYDFPLRDYAIAAKALTIYLEDETSYFRNTVTS
ncbi:MAG: hypothetical protein MJ233_03475 [Mycoplasmoidaceae bacterium]|nr:hypothetical protein [Mycoplasmoidaceae bacterium]